MARKRPDSELVKALHNASTPSWEADLPAKIAEQTEQARRNLEAKGLAQRPGESFYDWQRRTMAYFKEQHNGIGKAA